MTAIKVYHRNGKPLKTIGHSHTDSLKRIGEASFLEEGTTTIAPFARKRRGITVNPQSDFFSYCDNLIDERDDLCY